MEEKRKSDLIYLDGPLTADAILKTIHQRFLDQKNISWLGLVMIFLNSYTAPKGLSQSLRQFCKRIISCIKETGSQTVILSGLNGSGKTFLADALISEIGTVVSGSDEMIKNVMMAKIVLKSMGTASIPTNKDSSRLGRMIEFGIQERALKRIKFNCFYIDQSRVVTPNRFEGNFLIFYQMLAGLTPEDRAKLQLEGYSWHGLHYLAQACPPKEEDYKLVQSFELWKTGLAKLGIPLNDILQVLVAILLLGNVSFYESKDKELAMSGGEVLTAVANLLGVRSSALQRGLTKRTYFSSRGDPIRTACSAAGANGARDALSKALYVRTVVAIIRRINSLLRPLPTGPGSGNVSQTNSQGPHSFAADSFSPHRIHNSPSGQDPSQTTETVLNVIDLFGFENHESNGLEQFCINWTAEVVNNQFCKSVFTSVYEECRLDGVDPLIHCNIYDSHPCLELLSLEEKGLLYLINQETVAPRVQSDDICTRIKQAFGDHSCLKESRGSYFTVQHFAGNVTYDIISLLNSNADTIADDVIAIFNEKECKFGFMNHLFSHELNYEIPGGSAQGKMCRITPPSPVKGNSMESLGEERTFIQDFQGGIKTQILSHIEDSNPHFIRCVRANDSQRPGEFNRDCISQQLKNLSVLETVDQFMNGFSEVYTFDQLLSSFGMLVPEVGSYSKRPQDLCKTMMESISHQLAEVLEVAEDMWAIGRTKVFILEEFYQGMEYLREKCRHRAAVCIQSVVRAFLAVKHWPELKVSLQRAKRQRDGTAVNQDSDMPPYDSLTSHVPSGRNYTVVGNLKVGFPQWRVMKNAFPDTPSGNPALSPGQPVYVKGRSSRRGFLLVESEGQQFHVPHYYTEIRLPQVGGGSSVPPSVRVGSKTSDL